MQKLVIYDHGKDSIPWGEKAIALAEVAKQHDFMFICPDYQASNDPDLTIAAQACLPALGLGIGCLSGWTEIIIYPGAFRISRDERDTAGVVHHQEQAVIGESWSRGPLVLSWDDVERDGRNVVIHEIAHKLDVLNGPADGFPPLHRGMAIMEWSTSLSAAYESLV